jgi:hypothetical protein
MFDLAAADGEEAGTTRQGDITCYFSLRKGKNGDYQSEWQKNY